MQKQQLRNNKIKGRKIKNMPMFILIGLIAMIVIIAVIYYVFLRYSPEQIITYSGYAIEGKTMAENLKSSEISNIEQYLNLVEVKENDLLYKRLNSYYIGEDDKKEVDINYPMYINEGNTIFNISRNTKLITVNYEEVEGYPEFMLTGGVMYNGGDLTRADGNKYIFLKSEDEIYTNVQAIKIKTAINEYEIKEYSNIYFTEDAVTYYEMVNSNSANSSSNDNNNSNNEKLNENSKESINQNSYLQYKRIADIDNNSEIEVNGETLTYKVFLEKLGIIQSEEQGINNNENTLNETVENSIANNETQIEEENSNAIENETIEPEWQEGMWAKPEVICTDFEADVYTIRTNLSVIDRAGVITRGVIFEISLDGRLNRRVQATQTGELEITGLQPDTTYEIVGIVYYNNESRVEVEEEFYTGSVTTKSIDTLGTIDFSFENGTIYSNKIELIHLKINNDINEEVIKGISRLQLEIDGIEYRLSNDQVTQIKAGKEITYGTSETIDSNSKIRYEITAFDKFGNELKEINNTGETITSKQKPTASIRATKQDVTEVNLEVKLTNKDNVTLENYRYEIINQSDDKVKEGQLTKDTETLIFTDLDPNGYYQIIIYGDYDLENGEGKKQNQEFGRGSFVTRPIASLGYMQVKIDDKEVTQNSMNLGISIDSNQTDARLIAILDKVEVVIYDEGKNVINNDQSNGQDNNEEDRNKSGGNEDNEQEQGQEIKRITLTDEEVELLKTAEEVEVNLDQLTSNTKYKIDVITTVKQGTVEEVVEDKQNLNEIITLKMTVEVQIRNQFVIGDMIDLDIRVEDVDNAVLTNSVRIEVRDEENKLVNLSEMGTNGDYERKTYENLEPNTTYRIIIYAPQYNIGSTDETYEADYILKEIEILTEAGISGKLDLLSLEKTPAGKNLIDVSSKVNWYEKCFGTNYAYGLNYDESNDILTLGGTSGNNRLNYYDLSKYIGQEITISFKAKTSDDTYIQIIEKGYNDFNDTNYSTKYTINDLTDAWKEYSYTVTLNLTGYIGFRINDNNATIEIQDLQIELGNTKTSYEEFKYTYNANVNISVNDARDEITTNDYYIRIYKNNEQIQEYRYEEIGEENKVENVLKPYEVESDSSYKIELLVKVQDRYYDLDSQEFSTEGIKEIKGISNVNDFLKIQPYGEYIVLNDIDLSGASGSTYSFGNGNMCFDGTVNFNGKTLTRDKKNNQTVIFYEIGSNGIIENIVFNIKMNNEIETSGPLLVDRNYGSIRNIQINLIESTEKLNFDVYLIGSWNYGVIEDFVVNLQEPFYINSGGGLVYINQGGIIRNGYVYGSNVKIIGQSSGNSVIVRINQLNGLVENVYSLSSIDSKYVNNMNGVISGGNYENATVQNVYSVGIGENITNFLYGPNVYNKVSKKVYNNYYFTDEIFTSELEIKGNKLSLWDAEFQNQLINADGAFIVDELVNEGYYPWVDMPDVMPTQEYIELPEVEDADLPDILSTKVLEQGTDTVKVEFSVNNPSSENICNIKIENIEVEILSQEYKDGKSTVVAELKNPIVCVSNYDVLSISTRGSFNTSYTREYEEGERVINVDLYKEVWKVDDWKSIKNSPTENYILMSDLDFINEGNDIGITNVNGIINGNGHSISNIFLTNDSALIWNLYGTLENLYINNFNQEGEAYAGGLIRNAQSASIIDNLHMTDVNILKSDSGYVGGIVCYAYGSRVRNSSVNNIEINANISGTLNEMHIGGLAGRVTGTTIENCYASGLWIDDSKAVSTGVGGIIGFGSGANSLINCYAEGKITSDNINVGGVVGYIENGIIENCYSKVNISTTNNNIGGIVGIYIESDISTISNNLSIGNIYTTSGTDNLNRIVGNNEDTLGNNFSYENQLLNGYKMIDSKGAALLNKEELLNLSLGESYNYDGKKNGILPKLYNTGGVELLPNQVDIYLEDNNQEENVLIEIESTEAEKTNTTEAEINIRLKNPKEVEITGITIEDMESIITKNITQNGITNITIRATPERFYDSYKLTEIKYKNNNSDEEQIKIVETEIKVQFYKELYTYEDWQSIEEGTYQNYRLMADIDFRGRTNIKNNITVNRLEAENNIYTLRNINLEFDEANTGLIQNVKTSMKNIGFENITLTNAKTSGDYFGIVSNNNGNVENLKFIGITIEAEGISNVGLIGGMTSGNIENIKLERINIKGKSYVGGFIGNLNIRVYSSINNIIGNDVTVEGSENYVGGMVGYLTGGSSADITIECKNLKVENSNINGEDYVGGIIGDARYGNFSYLETYNTNVLGNSYIGGISGRFYSGDGDFIRYYMQVNSSTVNGNEIYIGGISGFCDHGLPRYILVSDCSINALSSNSWNIGGIFGMTSWSDIYYFQVIDSEVNSNGTSVGGVGNSYGGGNFGVYRGYIGNTIVQGSSKVGGILGNSDYSIVEDVYVNEKIKASSNTVGGIIGYLDNNNMTAKLNNISIRNAIVVETTVTAPTKAGGLIGDIVKEIYRDQSFYYNNYIDADVTSENASTGSLIIGGRPDENPYITNTHVYKYSTLNGDYVYASGDNIEDEQLLVRVDLDKQSTYSSMIGLGTTYWDYASLQEEKYPMIKDSYLYYPELQEGVNLPTDPEIVDLNSLDPSDENKIDSTEANENGIATQSLESLPEIKVYPISVNEINVDFSNITEGISFTYYINGNEIETIDITERTYTFEYNYVDEIEFVISNGVDEENITINPSDIKSEISLIGENYAYLNGNKLYINGELQSGEYVNLYEGLAMLRNGSQILDVSSGQIVESNVIKTSIEETAKPIHTYEYKDSKIEVYGTYSKVNGNIKQQIYNVRSGRLSALSNSLDMKIDNYIVDSYNDKEYQTILTNSGEIIDLKEQLQYPDNFLSRNVKQIVQNSNADNTEMMVIYNTGKVIVFNYVDGNIIYENSEQADSGLANYITGSINSIWSDYEDKQYEYARSKALIARLEEMPIEEILEESNNNSNSNSTIESINNIITNNMNSTISNNNTITNENSYITVYNGETGEYEVYSEEEILEGTEEEPVSETEKIKANGLESIYNYEQEEETGIQLNGALIVIGIMTVAMIALLILRKVMFKKQNITNKK